jgi:hypothetical protein
MSDTTTTLTITQAHLAVLQAADRTNLRVTNTTDLPNATVHHTTAKALAKCGYVLVEVQPTVKRGEHLAYLCLSSTGRDLLRGVVAGTVTVKQPAPKAWGSKATNTPSVTVTTNTTINTPTTEANMTSTTTTTTNSTSTNEYPASTLPRCTGCNMQCNPAYLNSGYCRKAGCEVKRRQALVGKPVAATPAPVAPPVAPSVSNTPAPVPAPVQPKPQPVQPVQPLVTPAEVKAVTPVKVPISEVRPVVVSNKPVSTQPTPAPVATPAVAPVATVASPLLTVEAVKAHLAAAKALPKRADRAAAAYVLLKAGMALLDTVTVQSGDALDHLRAVSRDLAAWLPSEGTAPATPAPAPKAAPVPAPVQQPTQPKPAPATPTPAPVAKPAPKAVDHRATVQAAIDEGTLGALAKACKAVGLSVDNRDGGVMRRALREWLAQGTTPATSAVQVESLPVVEVLEVVQQPATPAPVAQVVKPQAPKVEYTPQQQADDKRCAKAVGLSVVHYRCLRALAGKRPLTYRGIEAHTGYYNQLTAVMRQGKPDSLCTLGLATECEGSVDNPGVITFTITAKGTEYLAKAQASK